MIFIFGHIVLHVIAQSDYYFDHWCRAYGDQSLEFLDDKYCRKKFPKIKTNYRKFTCPTNILSNPPVDYYPDQSLKSVYINLEELNIILNKFQHSNACIILTKRVQQDNQSPIRAYNKYYCNGLDSAFTGFEAWSTTKNYAAANAAGTLRSDYIPKNEFGFDSFVYGKHGRTKLGDLVTIVNSETS